MSIQPVHSPVAEFPAARPVVRLGTQPGPGASPTDPGSGGAQDEAQLSSNARRALAGQANTEFKLHLSPKVLRALISKSPPPSSDAGQSTE